MPTGKDGYPAAIQSDKPVLTVLSLLRWDAIFLMCIIWADVWSKLPNFEVKKVSLSFEVVFSACRFCKNGVWRKTSPYKLTSIPFPASSKMRSDVASMNAPIPDNAANWSEPSSPNLSVILSATPFTVTLFASSE